MPRASNIVASRRRRKKILKSAKGYWGARSRLITSARQAVDKARLYAYRDRRQRKRDFRRLWIIRINAACREHGLSYSAFLHGLKTKGLDLDRRVLADIAARDPETFAQIVSTVKS
ncbi:MAG TPA: 50S ribosomal protein L20 [Bacteroidetes bacterium]|nr:50S ribosomal protein L20 [Bacteroidota bacterium]